MKIVVVTARGRVNSRVETTAIEAVFAGRKSPEFTMFITAVVVESEDTVFVSMSVWAGAVMVSTTVDKETKTIVMGVSETVTVTLAVGVAVCKTYVTELS